MFLIGQAASRSGLGIETIRYYERAGVIGRPGRAANGRRVYSAGEVQALRFVRRCRELSFSLAEAKALLALTQAPGGNCATVRELAEQQRDLLRQRIAEMERLGAELDDLSRHCREGRQDCPMLDQLNSD